MIRSVVQPEAQRLAAVVVLAAEPRRADEGDEIDVEHASAASLWRPASSRRDMTSLPPDGVVLGDDGTLIVLPTGSEAIEVTRLDP